MSGELYRDTKNHFRIALPDGWTLKQPQSQTVVLKAVDGKGGNINVSIMGLPYEVSADMLTKEWIDEMFMGIKEKFPDAMRHESGFAYIDNAKAVYNIVSYTYRILNVAPKITMMSYTTLRDRKLVTITCGSELKEFRRYRQICEKSIASFVFEGYMYR